MILRNASSFIINLFQNVEFSNAQLTFRPFLLKKKTLTLQQLLDKILENFKADVHR